MRKTIEQFNERADGTLDKEIKALFVSSIRFQLGKYIKFDDTEQKWYSENYSDDPIVDKEEDEEEKKPKKIAIKKYSGNGKRPFHDYRKVYGLKLS